MQKEIQELILKTIIYSDIFDYPLTKEEIWRFLIAEKSQKINKKEFSKIFKNLPSLISFKDGFYHFSKREDLIKKRLQRKKESLCKIEIAKKISRYLSLIPTIKFMGISGALAMKNSDEEDDIDLFIISKKNTLWITRFLIIFFLKILGRHRRRGDKNIADKICLNMLIDECCLCLPKEKQNLYTAHEVVQIMPLFERNKIYKKFIKANLWVKSFLPNSLDKILRYNDIKIISEKNNFPNILVSQYLSIFLGVLEPFVRKLQFWYMRKHRTTEVISDHLLAFHPLDYKKIILKKYKEKLFF